MHYTLIKLTFSLEVNCFIVNLKLEHEINGWVKTAFYHIWLEVGQ